ncbi:hypothetical protein SAMN04489716_9316 [Actinoplanes derwentensis]|uniref:Uncharacterized protein n=1 Tax=Actinoplanes derwentensis TaxID=113562 RepID=A0A1H2DDN0_9ACTN|nr:hypothetical protein Ade03nite_85700 [Actinoplanes derwentensis]SDT80694.1 hypothetical protein SAMN04489716_9316 [Actinoplanes derwentensis]
MPDWELVTFQRNLARSGDEAPYRALRDKLLGELYTPGRDVAFYVGKLQSRNHLNPRTRAGPRHPWPYRQSRNAGSAHYRASRSGDQA